MLFSIQVTVVKPANSSPRSSQPCLGGCTCPPPQAASRGRARGVPPLPELPLARVDPAALAGLPDGDGGICRGRGPAAGRANTQVGPVRKAGFGAKTEELLDA